MKYRYIFKILSILITIALLFSYSHYQINRNASAATSKNIDKLKYNETHYEWFYYENIWVDYTPDILEINASEKIHCSVYISIKNMSYDGFKLKFILVNNEWNPDFYYVGGGGETYEKNMAKEIHDYYTSLPEKTKSTYDFNVKTYHFNGNEESRIINISFSIKQGGYWDMITLIKPDTDDLWIPGLDKLDIHVEKPNSIILRNGPIIYPTVILTFTFAIYIKFKKRKKITDLLSIRSNTQSKH